MRLIWPPAYVHLRWDFSNFF